MSVLFEILKQLTMAFTLGLVVFYLLPVFATGFLEWEKAESVVGMYLDIAMSLIGRGLFLQRSHGGHKLVATTYDAKIGAELARIGGEVKHWRDPHNLMQTFRNKPFGLAHEDVNVVFDSRTIDIARRYSDLKNRGEWIIDGYRKAYLAYENTEPECVIVNISDALPAVQGSASPGLTDLLDTFVEKGQSAFNSTRTMQTIQWLMVLGASFGLMILAKRVLGSASSSGVAIPL